MFSLNSEPDVGPTLAAPLNICFPPLRSPLPTARKGTAATATTMVTTVTGTAATSDITAKNARTTTAVAHLPPSGMGTPAG